MLMYTVRRILATIPVLIAATLFTFFLVDLAGDPLAPLITATPPVPEETIQAMRERLYLDRPFYERYWLWLTGLGNTNGDIGLLQGKWGPSVSSTDIGVEMGRRFWITLRLVGFATIASIFLAVITGVISAVRQYSKTDHVLTFVGFLALAMPTFWLAVVIKDGAVWLNRNVFNSQVFFTRNATSPQYSQMEFWERMSDVAGHAILPTLTLMLTGYALISRFQRASMLEVLNSDYVRLARAKGLRNGKVMRRHALRTALIPVVTLTALTVSGALTGSVVVEFIFGWRGLGTFFLAALRDIDTFAMMAFIVFSGVLVIVANLIADLLYGVLDPRIRYE
jgi:peptide/nickel transport system permease protein